MESDYAIIGGGVVGLSVAWGLLQRGRSVTVLDGDDGSFRASRGNFGLVWVQSKGMKQPAYARWSQRSAAAWADFAASLREATGFDAALEQKGGYDLHFSDETLAETVAQYEILKAKLGGDYPYEILGHNELRREEPEVGPKVAGAILHHQDGHANPLKLLRGLAAGPRARSQRAAARALARSRRRVQGAGLFAGCAAGGGPVRPDLPLHQFREADFGPACRDGRARDRSRRRGYRAASYIHRDRFRPAVRGGGARVRRYRSTDLLY